MCRLEKFSFHYSKDLTNKIKSHLYFDNIHSVRKKKSQTVQLLVPLLALCKTNSLHHLIQRIPTDVSCLNPTFFQAHISMFSEGFKS